MTNSVLSPFFDEAKICLQANVPALHLVIKIAHAFSIYIERNN